ncbi:unnamed protein product [Rotaria socialis]|uniref:Uncharacterized protein n=1 Tax=Rotaria socialis TaxID=392032 RepID=A0A818G4D6_9BILA|nr:unnamed protein product [Rotaria socialis]CAF4327695.1 unnamed protein product [Rotaria socialis]
MGARNVRMEGSGLSNYGESYNSYDGYGGMMHSGSNYQPVGGNHALNVINFDQPLFGSHSSGDLASYGNAYQAGFNPTAVPGLAGHKLRQICVSNHVLGAFQNLLQQGSMGGLSLPQMMPQVSFAPPSMMPQMMPQMPCAPPPMMPQMPFTPPPMMSQMMPQMPCAPPPMMSQMMPQMPCAPPLMMPQMPMPQMGSNCCSMSMELPSMAPQMPQISFPPQMSMMPHQSICPPAMMNGFEGLSSYRGFGQAGYGGFGQAGLASYGQQAFGALGSFPQMQSQLSSLYSQQSYGALSQQPFGIFPQQPFGTFPQQPFGTFPQQPFGTFSQQPLSSYPGAGFNVGSGFPQFGGFSEPAAFPQVGGYSSMGAAQLGAFPGSTGRVTIVCCAIPQ